MYSGSATVLLKSPNSTGADMRRPMRWLWKDLPPLAISCLVCQDLELEVGVRLSRRLGWTLLMAASHLQGKSLTCLNELARCCVDF